MDETGNGSDGRTSLPAVADLLQAGALKALIEQGLASGNGTILDASAVQRISSPYLQVLVAGAAAYAHAGGPSMTVCNPSPAFMEAVSTLGLKQALGLS